MSYLINLPVESLHCIAQFLIPQDVLNFISIHPSFIPLLCHSKQFWIYLYEIHYGTYENCNVAVIGSSTNQDNAGTAMDWVKAKNQYLLKSYCSALPMVRWYPVKTSPPEEDPIITKKQKTEGVQMSTEPLFVHEEPPQDEFGLSACIGNYVVLYCEKNVYIKNIHQLNDGTTWKRLLTVNFSNLKHTCFGATLNTLDHTSAIMFGGTPSEDTGFEMSQVAVLHVEESETDISATATAVPNVWWEVINHCHVSDNPSMTCSDSNSTWLSLAGRSYHASTLLFNRYLFVIGGLQNYDDNILNPMLLDCQTWTWYVDGVTTSCPTNNNTPSNKRKLVPKKRHGCSLITDVECRSRLLLFGGSTGSDFNEISGNSEVWELTMNNCHSLDGVLSSMPWKWNLLHKDQTESYYKNDFDDDSEDEDDNSNKSNFQMSPSNVLSFVERLNLGQCHCGYRVGVDTVILAFGKVCGIMTNSVLCYNLNDDSFFRTCVHDSFHPSARNISESAYIESKGIIVFCGGVSDIYREGGCVSDTILLDLAPLLNVQEPNDRLWLPIDTEADSHTPTKVRLARC